MQKITLLVIFIALLFIPACSSRNQPRETFEADPSSASEEAGAIVVPSREAVFVYSNAQAPKRLVLTLAGEPILLPSGYMRLVGVVSGGEPIACLEIGGRGLAVGKGEDLNDYRVVWIENDHVVLERRN